MPPAAEGFASRLFLGPALRTQPDRRLVTLVREGYETAFEEIVRRYGRPLSRYAASIVGGRSEDVTQDAFSKALLALRRDDAEIELRPWLFRIVRNTALNDLRDSPPSPEVLAEALVGGGNPAEELERREELADLMKRLRELPEPQRAAIVMRELEGLGHEEIAAALGLTGGGARQAIYRARQALRDGAGMLIPLPLLQAMLASGGSGMAETAGAAGVSAAGVGGAAGAGIALKATAATVLVAVGAGVALKDSPRSDDAKAAPARVSQSGAHHTAAPAVARDTSLSRERVGGVEQDRHGQRSGEAEPGDDRGGHGKAEPRDNRGGEPEPIDDNRGHGGRGEAEPGDDHGAQDGSSGRHGGSSGSGDEDRSGSSSGSGHSGRSGSGSGSGHGDDSGSRHGGDSGSGHGGSGSGSSGSGSSGSGNDGSASTEGSSDGPEPGEETALDDDPSGSGSGSDDSGPSSGSGSGSSGGSGKSPESPS